MKIIVLHGQDSNKSYERLTKFVDTAKGRGWEILYDDLGETASLFGVERLVVIRDTKLITKKVLETLSKIEGTLVVYSEKDLPATFLKIFPNETKIEKFELPKILFTFLESFYPGNSTRCLQLLHSLVKTEAIELVFFMLARHLRDLYWVLIDPTSTGFPSWKIEKLKSQSFKFTDLLLTDLISELSDIDIKIKTGKSDLLTALDLLIIKKLE